MLIYIFINNSKIIIFNDFHEYDIDNFLISEFDLTYENNEETPILQSKWIVSRTKPSIKGIELRDVIYKSMESIDIGGLSVEINCSIVLKGEACFWLFVRQSDMSDNTVVVKVSKEDKCQRVFLSLGTWVDSHNKVDENYIKSRTISYNNIESSDSENVDSNRTIRLNNLNPFTTSNMNIYTQAFKTFTKQQLVDYSKVKNKAFFEKDVCEIKINIIDTNEERLSVKAHLNDNKITNELSSDFFLPFNGKYNIMFGGIGQQVVLKNLMSKCFGKIVLEGKGEVFTNDRRNCECCLVY